MSDEKIELAKRELSEIAERIVKSKRDNNKDDLLEACHLASESILKCVEAGYLHVTKRTPCNYLRETYFVSTIKKLALHCTMEITRLICNKKLQAPLGFPLFNDSDAFSFFLRSICLESAKNGSVDATRLFIGCSVHSAVDPSIHIMATTALLANRGTCGAVLDTIMEFDELIDFKVLLKLLPKYLTDASLEWILTKIKSDDRRGQRFALNLFLSLFTTLQQFEEFNKIDFWANRHLGECERCRALYYEIINKAREQNYIYDNAALDLFYPGFERERFPEGFFSLIVRIQPLFGTNLERFSECVGNAASANRHKCFAKPIESRLAQSAARALKLIDSEIRLPLLSDIVRSPSHESWVRWGLAQAANIHSTFMQSVFSFFEDILSDKNLALFAVTELTLAIAHRRTRGKCLSEQDRYLVDSVFRRLKALIDEDDLDEVIKTCSSVITIPDEYCRNEVISLLARCLYRPRVSKDALKILISMQKSDMSQDTVAEVLCDYVGAGEEKFCADIVAITLEAEADIEERVGACIDIIAALDAISELFPARVDATTTAMLITHTIGVLRVNSHAISKDVWRDRCLRILTNMAASGNQQALKNVFLCSPEVRKVAFDLLAETPIITPVARQLIGAFVFNRTSHKGYSFDELWLASNLLVRLSDDLEIGEAYEAALLDLLERAMRKRPDSVAMHLYMQSEDLKWISNQLLKLFWRSV